MLRFRHIDFSNLHPFDSEQSLQFLDGLTIIVGKNGAGKTTIVDALRREYEDTNNITQGGGLAGIPSWLIFFDRHLEDLPRPGLPWAPLVLLMASHLEILIRRNDFDSNLTKNIRELLGQKIESQSSKFLTVASSPGQLNAALNDNGAIIITSSDGECINDCFEATSERLALFLSINAAVRKLLSLDVPFVVDAQFRICDTDLLESCYQFIPGFSKQTIILEHDSFLERLGIKSNFQIIFNPDLNKSLIYETLDGMSKQK